MEFGSNNIFYKGIKSNRYCTSVRHAINKRLKVRFRNFCTPMLYCFNNCRNTGWLLFCNFVFSQYITDSRWDSNQGFYLDNQAFGVRLRSDSP